MTTPEMVTIHFDGTLGGQTITMPRDEFEEYRAMNQQLHQKMRIQPEPPTTAELEIAIDTSKFMRAIGDLAETRAAMFERAMQQFSNSLIPLLEVTKYPAEVHELSRNTGWSLEESADVYQRVAKWSADAITKESIEALVRSRMSKPNHYPTSTPTWSRRKR